MATLGGVTLPAGLFESERYAIPLADQYRIGDAQTLITYDPAGGEKYGWRLRWRMLASGDRDTLRTRYTTYGTQVYAPDDTTGTFNTQIVPGSWSQDPVTLSDGSFVYIVGFTVEEE